MDLSPDVVTVAITRPDGGMTIKRIIVTEYREPNNKEIAAGKTGRQVAIRREPTSEFIEAEIAKREALHGSTWRIVPNDYCDEATDRTYRNAWVDAPGRNKPDHDMPKAREIQRVFLRKQRLAEFCRLDNDYRIADEAGDVETKTRVGALRQKFRDVTEDPRIEEAKTVEELKQLTLKELVPETVGESFMNAKMRVSPSIESQQRN
jgi:hypothetical protein